MTEFALTTPAELNAFQLLRIRRALKLEIETGMKFSGGSIMNVAKEYCGSSRQTKRNVYADYDAWMVEQGFDSVELKPKK